MLHVAEVVGLTRLNLSPTLSVLVCRPLPLQITVREPKGSTSVRFAHQGFCFLFFFSSPSIFSWLRRSTEDKLL